MEKPKLTIHCITYNHEKYIAQALESFVMQKTNFHFEAIIGDDASTDRTQEIIKKYVNKHPDILKAVLRKKNVGPYNNSVDIFNRINSKYVSLCEGDDFFTDPLKLQKQVDFLDAHPEYSICFHPVKVFYEDNSQPNYIFPDKNYDKPFNFETLLTENFIQTNSCVYRWRFNNEKIEDFYPKDIAPGDLYLHLLHAQKGKIGFISEVMSSYRKHSSGIWYKDPKKEYLFWFKNAYFQINFYEQIKINLNANKFKSDFQQAYYIRKLIWSSFKLKDFNKLKLVFFKYPKLKLKLIYLIPLTYIKTIKNFFKKFYIKIRRI